MSLLVPSKRAGFLDGDSCDRALMEEPLNANQAPTKDAQGRDHNSWSKEALGQTEQARAAGAALGQQDMETCFKSCLWLLKQLKQESSPSLMLYSLENVTVPAGRERLIARSFG